MDGTWIRSCAHCSDIDTGPTQSECTSIRITGGAVGGDESGENWQEKGNVKGEAEHRDMM